MIFSKMPFLRLVVCFSLGILLQTCFTNGSWTLIVGLAACALFLLSLWERYVAKHPLLFFKGAFLLSLFILLGVLAVRRDQKPSFDANSFSETVLVEVVAPPMEKPKSIQLLTRVADSVMTNHRLLLYVAKDSLSQRLCEGDYLLIRSSYLKRVDPTATDAYLKSKEIQLSCYIPSSGWMFCGRNDSFSLIRLSHAVQKRLVGVFRDYGLEGDELSVLSALTIGDKSLLDKDLKRAYSTAGASHILAVSGLHVGVVYFVFVFLLSQLLRDDRYAKVRSVIALLALWSYTFVTGLSPSVVRASVMLSMVSVAQMIGRKSQTMNTVFASAFMMLLVHPAYLFDVGFQLSYVAVLSILLFQEPIYQVLVCQNKWMDKGWSLLSVTLAAQLGTMPLVLYYFHQFSNYFWLSGFVVIPLSSVIIYLSMLLWVVQWWTTLGVVLACVLRWLAEAMNYVVRAIEDFCGAVVSSVGFSLWDMLFVYLLCLTLLLFCKKNSFRNYSATLVVLFVYALFQTINKIFFVT